MERSEIFERVKKCVAKHTIVEAELITEESMLAEELNFDSIDLINLGMELEEQFADIKKLDIPEGEIIGWFDVEEIVTYLEHVL